MPETGRVRIQYKARRAPIVINRTPQDKEPEFCATMAQNPGPYVCHDRALFLPCDSIHQIRHQCRTDTLIQLRNTGHT